MSDLQQAVATQLANIEKRSGKSLSQLRQLVLESGLQKHSELVAMLKTTLDLGHGDANALVHYARESDGVRAAQAQNLSTDEAAQALYTGAKAALWPIHQQVMAAIAEMGQFEILPKKSYLSLRRSKQFAMLGPATNTRVELGLNMKNVTADARLLEQPTGGMCQYKVKLSTQEEVDQQVIDWIKIAFDAAA